jgi:hypothetical protein
VVGVKHWIGPGTMMSGGKNTEVTAWPNPVFYPHQIIVPDPNECFTPTPSLCLA